MRDEARLRVAVETYLDRRVDFLETLSPHQTRATIRDFVAGEPDLSWAMAPPTPPGISWRLRETAHKVAVPALLVLTLPVGVPAALARALALRWHEPRDPFPEVEPPAERLQVLGAQRGLHHRERVHQPGADPTRPALAADPRG